MTPTLEKAVANPTIVLREEFDDWAILFDPDTGKAFGLNPTSVFIWKLLDGKNSAAEIAKKLSAKFNNVPAEASEHVNKVIQDLVEKGFAGYETKK
jgi:SynChlorMet cassette protein ScmD